MHALVVQLPMGKPHTFLTVCMNPTLQKTLVFDRIRSGEVNRSALHRFDVSGKGINVTRVLVQLGKKAAHLTHLGGELKPVFLALSKNDDLDLHFVESGSMIRFCYTIVTKQDVTKQNGKNYLATELVEEAEPVGEETEERLMAAYAARLAEADTVIISGTKAQGYSDALVPAMARLARESKKRIILDVRGSDLRQSLPYSPDLVKPNLFEFVDTFRTELNERSTVFDFSNKGELTGDEPGVKESVAALTAELAVKYKTAIVLTRGSRPVWYTDNGALLEVSVPPAETVNATGSGDAFTAGLAAALSQGLPLRAAIERGVECGRLNALSLKPGVIRDISG